MDRQGIPDDVGYNRKRATAEATPTNEKYISRQD